MGSTRIINVKRKPMKCPKCGSAVCIITDIKEREADAMPQGKMIKDNIINKTNYHALITNKYQ